MNFRSLVSLFLLAGIWAVEGSAAEDKFPELVHKAAMKSNLTAPGSAPFHMKLVAVNSQKDHPEFAAEIEVWWAGPEKWRREVHSPMFSQTAIQNGPNYYESNSTDYLPWWLHELVTESLNPVPLEELRRDDVDFTGRCGHWESEFAKNADRIAVHNQACFGPDGTVLELFTRTVGAKLGNYKSFEGKRAPGTIVVWPQSPNEVTGTVTVLEKLNASPARLAVPNDTGLAARIQFVSVPESELQLDRAQSPPLQWPVVHNFPARGVMAVNVKLDRAGNVQEVGTVVSGNFVLDGPAREQVKRWKFRPYLKDGFPVQVNTTLIVPYETKMELLGANGKSVVAEPFLDRMKKSRELSDPRRGNTTPFHLHANFEVGGTANGSYEETWLSSQRWSRRATTGSSVLSQSYEDSHLTRSFEGPEAPRRLLEVVIGEIDGRFPDLKYAVYEADWGQSAVQFDGEDMARVARGAVDENNQPTSGQAYWFDAVGLLRGAYQQPTTASYSDFQDWNGKRIPRRIEITRNTERLLVIVIDKIESPVGTLGP